MNKKNILIIVDPQNDFVDPEGSLYVHGAEGTIDNICNFLKTSGDSIDEIIVSLDSHSPLHIANSNAWKEKPEIGQIITLEDVVSGKFVPAVAPKMLVSMAMRELGNITIWPEHCIVGTWGHSLPKSLSEALRSWEIKKLRPVTYQRKGEDINYEAYSLLTDEKLQQSKKPLWRVNSEALEKVYISGFCKDICVAETVKDLIETDEYSGKLVALEDCLCTLNPNNPSLEIYKTLKAIEI